LQHRSLREGDKFGGQGNGGRKNTMFGGLFSGRKKISICTRVIIGNGGEGTRREKKKKFFEKKKSRRGSGKKDVLFCQEKKKSLRGKKRQPSNNPPDQGRQGRQLGEERVGTRRSEMDAFSPGGRGAHLFQRGSVPPLDGS